MALASISVPAFPDVPHAPGVPSVPRKVGAIENAAVLLVSDVATVLGMFAGPQWGIFGPGGVPLIIGDSVVGVDFRQEWRVSDYPVEQGGFASYDKVAVPFDVRVTFSVSGSGSLLSSLIPGGGLVSLISGQSPGVANRTAALTLLQHAAASLTLYSVRTPEFAYDSCNIVHYDYRREARNGATLIKVDVWLVEVRIAAPARFTGTQSGTAAPAATPETTAQTGTSTGQTQSPSSADPQSTGTVQAQPPTPSQASTAPQTPAATSANEEAYNKLSASQQKAYDAEGSKVGNMQSRGYNGTAFHDSALLHP